MGTTNGLWCLGCCWALMASLFAVEVMNITGMAIIAGFIGVEKALPWRRSATYGIAVVLLALGVFLLVAPDAVPWLGVTAEQSMPGNVAGIAGNGARVDVGLPGKVALVTGVSPNRPRHCRLSKCDLDIHPFRSVAVHAAPKLIRACLQGDVEDSRPATL